MKFVSLLFTLATIQASAGYECKTDDGEAKLEIGGSWQTGSVALLDSEAVRNFYLLKYGISIKKLKTVIDPDTGRAVSKVETNDLGQATYSFMQQSSSGSSIWALKFNSALHFAVLTDQEGNQFQWTFKCRRTADLELPATLTKPSSAGPTIRDAINDTL